MNENLVKRVARAICFRPGAVRRIGLGPMRGMRFRVSAVTGLSPWYSGTERRHQRAFRRLIAPGGVAVDVGANWGAHTLYLSRLVGPTGRVVALEPYPPAFEALAWHLSANGCENVTALPLAASDRDGRSPFCPGTSPSTGRLAGAGAAAPPAAGRIDVRTQTLDRVARGLGLTRCDLVKIDVEGAEGQVLVGAEWLAGALRPCFVIDLHTPDQDVFVGRWLTGHDYRVLRLSGVPVRRPDVGWPDPEGVWGAVLGVPAEAGA